MLKARAICRVAALIFCLASILPCHSGNPNPVYVIRAVLTEPKPTFVSHYGNSVSLGDGRLAVGACWATVGAKERAGAVYLYDLSGTYIGLLVSATPKPNTGFAGDPFSTTPAAMSGTSILVGEYTGAGGGRVFIFSPDGTRQTVPCPDPRPGFQFGTSVYGDGDNFLVGAYAGGAWLFDRLGNPLVRYIPAGGSGKCFGMSVSMKDQAVVVTQDHVAVGDTQEAGMAYLFDRSGKLVASMHAPIPEYGSGFGVCADTDAEVVAVGAPGTKVGGIAAAGAVYLYSARDGSFIRTLLPPEPVSVGRFGISVAVDEGRILVGAPGANVAGIAGAGACYLFDTEGHELAQFSDPQPTQYACFGRAVDIRGKNVIIGESAATIGETEGAGKAILFEDTSD